MARDSTMDKVLYYGMVFGGAYVGISMAAGGAFGAGAQTFGKQFLQALRLGVPTVSAGPGGVTATLPSGSAPRPAPIQSGAPCNSAFIPGQQYVDFRDGLYHVVVGGQERASYADRATAEADYNRRVCG